MDINQIQEATKKRIWQAIAGSGVNVSSIAKADLEKLVDTIAQEVLEEFDEVVGQSAAAAATASRRLASGRCSRQTRKCFGRAGPSCRWSSITSSRTSACASSPDWWAAASRTSSSVRIKDLDWRQGVGERMFGIGDIIVTSVDATEPRAVLRNVKHPEQVYEILRRAMLEARKKYHIIFQQEM